MDRLAELARHRLGTALHGYAGVFSKHARTQSGNLVANFIEHSLYIGHRWSLDEVSVSLGATGGYKVLKTTCTRCHTSDACLHGFAMVVSAVRLVRPDVDALLDNNTEVQKRTFSSDAAAFLDTVASLGVGLTDSTSSQNLQPTTQLIYRLEADVRGFFSKLAVTLGVVLKTGGYSARSNTLDWSELLVLTKVKSEQVARNQFAHSTLYSSQQQSRWNLQEVATDGDKRFAKEIFLQAGLPPHPAVQITTLSLLEPIRALCQEKRLFLSDDLSRPLVFGASKPGSLTWKRDNKGGWRLSLLEEGGLAVVPCNPPMYVNSETCEIGKIEVDLTARDIELVAMAKSLTDRDIEMIRAQPQAGALIKNLPALPKVVVEHVGMATPGVSVSLKWIYDADAPRQFSVTKRRSDMGEATVQVNFNYAGLRPRVDDSTELERTDGEKTLVYSRDINFELDALDLVSMNSALEEDVASGAFLIHRGSSKSAATKERIQEYQASVVSEMHRRGWTVRMNEHWPMRQVELDTLNFTSSDLGDGWFGFDLSTQVHGARIDMLALLKDALTNRSLLAAIAKANDRDSFRVMSPEGYEISVPVTRLKRLLPFFLTITMDDDTGKAKLRRIDFGVLEDARKSDHDVIDGGTGLLEVSDQLSEFSPALPQHTLDSMAEPAREYQVYGAAWADVRRRLGFGAIIGDEYAVGKTLQTTISVFNAANEKALDQPCCLIVLTKTLFFGGRWQEDIQRFIPKMQFAEIYGARQIGRLTTLDGLHAVLTTYDTVVDQLESFQAIAWNVIACDEGHKVNNSNTLAYKAVASLRARQKLIITGSPMQNGAREIWALMNLVAPGLLKDRTWFNKTFPKAKLLDADLKVLETADEAQLANTARLHALGKIISPFFLRRTNTDLGRQLPPVQVIERHISMDQDQADVYEAIRAAGKKEALAAVEAKGLNLSRLDVLTQINRLRQVCCDPSIVTVQGKRELKASSAKREAILDICKELVADNRKIVITSEWNRLLHNIAADLKVEDIEAVFMSGELTGRNRLKVQEEFRTGKASVMLIQLTLAEGIELPEGDAIIICEPWWNRKKEEQAIARLRRDERDKHINVIRLIVPGSVEVGVTRVAQNKLDDIEAVQMGHAAASGGLSIDDVEEFFKPLEKSAIATD